MCQRTIFSRSCIRIAEEVQLQAEEEWIVDTLKKIKQQRNCLQIERLHLESLKSQLKNSTKSTSANQQPSEPQENEKQSHSLSKRTELMSAVDMMNLGSMRHKDDFFDMNDDTHCNNQELNLNISSSCFNVSPSPYRRDYGSDDDSASDISDGDNVKIDMNMLMNGTTTTNRRSHTKIQ